MVRFTFLSHTTNLFIDAQRFRRFESCLGFYARLYNSGFSVPPDICIRAQSSNPDDHLFRESEAATIAGRINAPLVRK
jgi:hypothetical protein